METQRTSLMKSPRCARNSPRLCLTERGAARAMAKSKSPGPIRHPRRVAVATAPDSPWKPQR